MSGSCREPRSWVVFRLSSKKEHTVCWTVAPLNISWVRGNRGMGGLSILLDYNMTTSVQFFAFFSVVPVLFCKYFHCYNAFLKRLSFPCLCQLPDSSLFDRCSFLCVYPFLIRFFPPQRVFWFYCFIGVLKSFGQESLKIIVQMLYLAFS